MQEFFYFSTFEEFAYFLGLIALFLAIIQFGLPYSPPYVFKFLGHIPMFKNKPQSVVLTMVNKVMGYFTFWVLFIAMPLVLVIFTIKFLSTTALWIGYTLNSGMALLISALLLGAFSWWFFRSIKKDVTDNDITLPKTEAEEIRADLKKLSQSMNALVNQLHSTNLKLEVVSKSLRLFSDGIGKQDIYQTHKRSKRK